MKTKEELNVLKEEVEALNKKLAELTEEELAQVSGGTGKAFTSGNYTVGDWVKTNLGGGGLGREGCGERITKDIGGGVFEVTEYHTKNLAAYDNDKSRVSIYGIPRTVEERDIIYRMPEPKWADLVTD